MIKVSKQGGYYRASACGLEGGAHTSLEEALKSLCAMLYKRRKILEELPSDMMTDKAREQHQQLSALLS